jgi:hypothetical protein
MFYCACRTFNSVYSTFSQQRCHRPLPRCDWGGRCLGITTTLTGPITSSVAAAAACAAGTCAVGNLCLPQPFGGCGTGINYNTATRAIKAPNLIPIFYGTWTAAQKTIISNFLSGIGECLVTPLSSCTSHNTVITRCRHCTHLNM